MTCRKATRQTLKSAQAIAPRGSAKIARMRMSKPSSSSPSSASAGMGAVAAAVSAAATAASPAPMLDRAAARAAAAGVGRNADDCKGLLKRQDTKPSATAARTITARGDRARAICALGW
eukprot:CAMPEP_0171215422 /NCGR_PEP_ID=MMETSP0790-20130122/31659_1 /TAXON_ID=2925 /ORGANISM="Alexandrium catenella, Strain OF101" /LENGTH=118 /DNA_ID=CAMNT_0011681175 /DNA_START=132 /DNA_END=488 /DNA_ORIENTATION=-